MARRKKPIPKGALRFDGWILPKTPAQLARLRKRRKKRRR